MKKTIATILLASMILLSGCTDKTNATPAKDSDPESAEKVLTFGTTGYFCNESWDPAQGWDGWYIQYYGMAETLFKLDDELRAYPLLAESFENTDETTWVFTLRDDVTFHNGDKMTAASVKGCFERTMSVNARAEDSIPVESIEADGQVLTIKTKKPVPTIANDLCDPLWVVYNPDNTDNFADMTYFTGPYMPVSFDPNVETVVTKNENYWGEPPKLDKVVFKTITDEDALIMGLQNGEIDVVVPLSSTQYPVIKGNDKFTVDDPVATRGEFFQFNLERPVFKDKAVRKAIAMCIDREGFANTICNGLDAPSYGVYSDILSYGGIEGLSPEVAKMDVEGAKALLKDAGYADTNGNSILDKDGVELSFEVVLYSTYTAQIQMLEVLQNTLKDLGVEMKIKALETPNDFVHAGNFDLASVSYGMAPTGNPQYFINLMFASTGSSNFGHYSNPEVDRLAEKLASVFDENERLAIVREIENIIINDFGFVFFGHEKFPVAYNTSTVKNIHVNPSEYYILDSSVEAY